MPRNAVLQGDKGSYIFQITKGYAKRIDVTTGIETDQLMEISSNFDPSLKVVAVGNYELQDGMAVRESSSVRAALSATANPEGSHVGRLNCIAPPIVALSSRAPIVAVRIAGFSLPVTLFPNVSIAHVRLSIDAGDRPAEQMVLQLTASIEAGSS